MVTELREELRKAREAAQLLKEATEVEKQAAYDLGVQKTQARLTEEFSTVVRDYCDITWGKALDVAGVPADSNLRRPKSIYYDSDIRELPGSDSPPQEHLAKVSEVPLTSQVPPALVEVPMDSRPNVGQEKEVEAPKVKDKSKDKGKGKTSDTTISLPEPVADPGAPKAQVQGFSFNNVFIFLVYCFCIYIYIYFFFVKELYYTFTINENVFLLFHKV